MKKSIKFSSVFVAALMAANCFAIPVNAASYDAFALELGIKLDKKYYTKIGRTRELRNDVYSLGTKIGSSRHYVIFATNKTKAGNKYQNIALYYSEMMPVKGKGIGFVNSDSLQITSDLNHDKDHYRGYKLTKFSEPKASSYTKSYNVGINKDGISAGISIPQSQIKVYNYTNSDCYNIKYVYGLANIPARDAYLLSNSDQYGAYYYITDGNAFNYPLKVCTKFDVYDAYGRPVSLNASDTMKWSVELSS